MSQRQLFEDSMKQPKTAEAIEAARYLWHCLGGASARGSEDNAGWSRAEIARFWIHAGERWPWLRQPAKNGAASK